MPTRVVRRRDNNTEWVRYQARVKAFGESIFLGVFKEWSDAKQAEDDFRTANCEAIEEDRRIRKERAAFESTMRGSGD